MKKIITFIVLFLFFQNVRSYEFDGFRIDVPEDFVVETEEVQGSDFKTIVFKRPHDDSSGVIDTGTILQINIWDPKQKIMLNNEQQSKEAAQYYLLSFLDGIKNSRDDFNTSAVGFLSLANITAAKINWNGSREGLDLHGIMYSFVHKSKVYTFSVQDFTQYKGEFIEKGIDSIEKMMKVEN